jgi:hypothetical protein
VISNIGYFSSSIVPGMMLELEQAFGKPYEQEKEVRPIAKARTRFILIHSTGSSTCHG